MNKAEYMLRLERAIIRLPRTVRDEILYDYEEHFRLGMEAGKSEEEISRELGTPEEIAQPYVENLPPPQDQTYTAYNPNIPKAEPSSTQKILMAILVIFINLVFISGIAGTVFGIWVAFAAICFAFFVAGIALVIAAFIQPVIPTIAMIFFGLAMLAITFPLCYGFYKASVGLGKLIKAYVKFCINLVNKGGAI